MIHLAKPPVLRIYTGEDFSSLISRSIPRVKLSSRNWILDCGIVMRAFHGLPPGIEDMPLKHWKEVVKQATEIVKHSF